jgi:hypothetical protein
MIQQNFGGGRVRMLALVVISLLAGGLLVTAGPAVAAQITNAFITNDDAHSVPVHGVGTLQVGGTVNIGNGASQPIPVAQTPTATQNLAFASFDFNGTSAFDVVNVDVPTMTEVRVTVNYDQVGSGINVLVQNEAAGNEPMTMDFFRVDGDGALGGLFETRVYQVVGPHVRISVLAVDNGNTSRQLGSIGVWGRTR